MWDKSPCRHKSAYTKAAGVGQKSTNCSLIGEEDSSSTCHTLITFRLPAVSITDPEYFETYSACYWWSACLWWCLLVSHLCMEQTCALLSWVIKTSDYCFKHSYLNCCATSFTTVPGRRLAMLLGTCHSDNLCRSWNDGLFLIVEHYHPSVMMLSHVVWQDSCSCNLELE